MKRILAALLLVVLLSGGAAAYWIYATLHTPVYHTKRGQYIEIPRGSSPSTVLRKLANLGHPIGSAGT